MRNLGIVKNLSKLRQMILDNPDLPIVVLAGDCASDGEHRWTYCSKVNVGIDTILDADILNYGDCVFCDRKDLEDYLTNELDTYPDNENLSNEEFNMKLQKEIKKYEPYWKKVICIWVDN